MRSATEIFVLQTAPIMCWISEDVNSRGRGTLRDAWVFLRVAMDFVLTNIHQYLVLLIVYTTKEARESIDFPSPYIYIYIYFCSK
jgi:hypothetical protein